MVSDGSTDRLLPLPERAGISRAGRGTGVLVRLDDDDLAALDRYCAARGVTRPEALRIGLTAITLLEGTDRGR